MSLTFWMERISVLEIMSYVLPWWECFIAHNIWARLGKKWYIKEHGELTVIWKTKEFSLG